MKISQYMYWITWIHDLNAAYIASPYYGIPWVKILQYIYICLIFLSDSQLYELLNLSSGGNGPHFRQCSALAWPLQTNWKNESCILPGSISPESDVLSVGKMNQVLWLVCFFQMKIEHWLRHNHKKMPVADGLSPPPPPTHALICMKMTILFYSHLWTKWFHHGHNSVMQSTWLW